MSTAVTTKKRDIRDLLQSDNVKSQLAMVLPKHLTADRMARVACTAILKTPKLAQCRPESLLQALMVCSQAGLEPDGRNAHLIPYGDQVQVIFDYKGLVALAKRNGVDVKAEVVRANDDFEYLADDGSGKTILRHSFNAFADRGGIVGVYSRAIEDGKSPDYEIMSVDEVNSIRKRSRASDSGPWVTDYSEMAKKTAIRRHSKRWNLSLEVAEAINGDDDIPKNTRQNNAQPAVDFAVEDPAQDAQTLPPHTQTTPEPANAPQTQPATQEAAHKSEPKPAATSYNYLKAIRGLMAIDKIEEAPLLDYLREVGTIEESLSSLDEIATLSPSSLVKIHDGWKLIAKEMKQ